MNVPIDGGSIPAVGGVVAVGHTVSFFCREGFKLEGEASDTCQADKTFSNQPPTCVQRKLNNVTYLKSI